MLVQKSLEFYAVKQHTLEILPNISFKSTKLKFGFILYIMKKLLGGATKKKFNTEYHCALGESWLSKGAKKFKQIHFKDLVWVFQPKSNEL